MVSAALLYDARFGAITGLSAGFLTGLSKENNGLYLIPWGRVGTMAKQVKKGLDGGSGTRLWDLLETKTVQYA